MDGRSSKGWKIAAAIGGTLVVAAAITGVLVVKAHRDKYVREALAFVPAAEEAYREGRFPDAVEKATSAVVLHEANSAWFEPSSGPQIHALQEFLNGQLTLWRQAERIVPAIDKEPAAARAALDRLLVQAAAAGARGRPLTERLEASHQVALTKEREAVEAAAAARIPNGHKAYEQGQWDVLLATQDEVRDLIASLPDSTRETAARKLEGDLTALEKVAAPVSAMRSIRDGKDDGFVKADRLRDLISRLSDLKGRDLPLHRDLRKAIAEVDPETRKPPAGIALKENYPTLLKTFSEGNGLEAAGNPDDTTVIELQGPAHRYAIRVVAGPQILIEVDRVRLLFSIPLVDNRETLSLETAATLSRRLRASRHPRVFADEAWVVQSDAPDFCAVNVHDKAVAVLLGDRVYEGTVADAVDFRAMATATGRAARELEKAVRESPDVPDEVKGPMTALLNATYVRRVNPADFLDPEFCREAAYEDYLDAQLPKLDGAVAAALKEYRRAYGERVQFRPRYDSKAGDGSTATFLVNGEDDSFWRVIDRAADTTTYSMVPRDHMRSRLAAVSVFAGVHEEFPAAAEPVEVRMSHGTAGTVSRWTAAGGKLEFDPDRWAKGVTLGDIPEVFGTGAWQVPPHALKVDARGQGRELILPAGAVKLEGFGSIPAGPARRAAQDRLLQRCSEVFRTPGEYHLFYRYFVQYVLDSPVTTATTLIGSSRHCGDAHQDAYQTLDRRLNGRFLADCDDLAEFYWTVLRRQNRPAFVLGVPGHATCGVAEKGDDGWTFFCVDTGPARQLKGADLDAVIEKLLRTYDRDGSMTFDPRQMRFLFRFGGEQTRSDYFLDSRILRDPEYSDLMIRVQEYWHFGFYALGIETMSRVLETDRMPANCQEIAGLYTRVGLWEDALKWTRAGIEGLDAKDQFTGLNDTMRVAQCLRELERKDEASAELKKSAKQISEVLKSNPKLADRYRGLKFTVAAQMAESDLPWDGWKLVEREVTKLVEDGHAAESLMLMVINVYEEMNKAVRAQAALSDDQKEVVSEIGALLDKYFSESCFEADDSSMDLARKFGAYFGYRMAQMGREGAVAELVKPEYPKETRRPTRRSAEYLSWPWLRLSPVSYLVAAGDALNMDQPNPGGPKAAIEVIRALEAALPEIRKQGSLGTLEFQVLDLRLQRACFEMDEKAARSVFDEMKRQGWGALYESLSSALGGAAVHMKVEEFEKFFRIYCEYGVPRRHYYGVVYAALAGKARAQALAASRVCIERFPNDADMKREHALLEKLGRK